MTILQALVLGIVQGLTEFLPISSTAHLILVPWALGWTFDPEAQIVFDVLVQWGTLLALFVYFRRDLAGILRAVLAGIRDRRPLATPESRLGWWIALGTVPVVVLGLACKHPIEALHHRPVVVAGILIGATGLLYLGERWGKRDRPLDSITAGDALVVGAAQALALLPGVSRSGATITGGLLRGLDRAAAARFSFLLSIPALLGAGAVKTRDLLHHPGALEQVPVLAAGLLASAVVGYASIHWLMGFLARRPLTSFALYRVLAGLALLGLALYRG